MQGITPKKLTPSKLVAYTAIMCALLIGGQIVFSAVVGVEVVTLLLLCFSVVFGAKAGAICGTAFSILRCAIFGFSPTAFILYIVYYPSFGALFGAVGHISKNSYSHYPLYLAVIANFVLCGLAVLCAVCNILGLIKISVLYKTTVTVLLWVICGLCAVMCAAFDVLFVLQKRGKDVANVLELLTVAGLAAVCTVCFTLLDDIICPMFYGWSSLTALTYFYASLMAMLPQTVCTIVSACTLYLPLTAVLKRTAAL
ncbi:MAG: hypothetical protein K2L12_08285 [Clostridia bacterium]|nr:hypothetical protein [Clostridia bacterium]